MPHYLASAGLQVRATEVLRLSATVTAQGDYYLDRTNTQGRAGRHALLDLAPPGSSRPRADVGRAGAQCDEPALCLCMV